jgi:1-acyl-sn-glycerol-3-phosphate acyltransferase
MSAPGSEYRIFTPERGWKALRIFLQSWAAPMQRLVVYGGDRVPDGPCVVASNHIGAPDPITLGFACRRSIRYMAKVELWEVPLLGKAISHLGTFPVDRGKGDREAIRMGREVLRDGELLGIFVEGTRQSTDEIGAAKTGAAMMAVLEGAPIIPVCIQGTDRTMRNPFHPVTVAWGTPMDVSGLGRSAGSYRAIAGAIVEELRDLRAFIHAADAAGRPRGAVPPRSRAAITRETTDEPA